MMVPIHSVGQTCCPRHRGADGRRYSRARRTHHGPGSRRSDARLGRRPQGGLPGGHHGYRTQADELLAGAAFAYAASVGAFFGRPAFLCGAGFLASEAGKLQCDSGRPCSRAT
jgi:hypothetical protein